ncbi:MAG TPA: thiamine pyrophosphate-binding protein, partial [Terriglobia bacterium]|nr:thiamine pyrophosphate-binding protein [Terriglobia bacterium]
PAAEADAAEAHDPLITEHPGSDFMVDVFKTLDIEYIAANPGSSFRSLQESFINYGKNRNPEWLTCMHEESSVAMAHGYYKIEGKPMMVMAHGTVGLQHAAMAVYNAYCDRVPVYIVLGNTFDATQRRPGAEWVHSVQDAAAMVRDYIKWDDMPISLGHFAESAVRAYKIAMTPPREPVILVADSDLQERPMNPAARPRIPRLTIPRPPAGDPGAVEEAARMLVGAENPVILSGRLGRTQNSIELVRELAEALQCNASGDAMPSLHPLQGGNVRNADVILALEPSDLWGALNSMTDQLERTVRSNLKAGAKIITIASTDLYTKSNYQDFQRFQEVDLAIAADAEATLPSLIEAVRRLTTSDRKRFFADRGRKLAERKREAMEQARKEAALEWDLSPISPTRISYELWEQIKNKDWSLLTAGRGGNPHWNFTKHYQRIGGSGGSGVGYGAPASVGAALANRKYGRLSICIQNDGDLMYAPGVLWTAAHHRIPLLMVMNNNRAYHQEVMHLQRMACRHNRDLTTAHIGNVITDPDIDFAKVAQGLGWYAEGPITDPKEVGPALKRAIARVEAGEPALLDTVMQPR